MSERGETHRGRDATIAVVGAGLGAASVLAFQWWTRSRSGPDREYVPMVWDPNIEPGAVERAIAAISPAAIDPIQGRRYKTHLAVVQADLGSITDALLEDPWNKETAHPAVIIQDRKTQAWHVGVMEADSFGERPGYNDQATVATHLGQPAIAGTALALVSDGEILAFDTEVVEISDITTVLNRYPNVPILQNHPIQN